MSSKTDENENIIKPFNTSNLNQCKKILPNSFTLKAVKNNNSIHDSELYNSLLFPCMYQIYKYYILKYATSQLSPL